MKSNSNKALVRRCCGFVLLSVLLCLQFLSADAVGEGAQPLTLELQLKESRPLEKDCYGANIQLHHGPIWFDHPALAEKYIEAGKPFFRFPGGTPANFYNPETGLMNEEVPSSHHDYAALNKKILQKTGGAGDTPTEFFEFAEKTGARYSVVLNVCTRTVEQNRAWLEKLAKRRMEIPCFEIGNELYFGSYDWAFANPQDYVTRAKASTKMIREIFPETKVGVVAPSHIYTFEVFLEGRQPHLPKRQQQWMELLEKERFFDAVVIHLYSNLGMDKQVKEEDLLPFAESYSNVMNYAERHLDKALDLLEVRFPGKEIWITEYGIGGFRGALGKYGLRRSHLGSLHNDLMLLRFLSRPSVTVSNWHSFSQCIDYDRGGGGIKNEPLVPFHHLTLFAEPVRNSEQYVPVHNDAGNQVEAGAFIGSQKGYVIVLNKRAERRVLKELKPKERIRLTGAIQLSPRKDIPLADALESAKGMDKTELTGEALQSIVFPPYSISRLEFVRE